MKTPNTHSLAQLDNWFQKQSLQTLENITGLARADFMSTQEFIEEALNYWNDLPHNIKEGYFEMDFIETSQ